MKTRGTPHWYVSGPHSRDYYLLLDEQGGQIFAMRLATHIREARGICDEHADCASASLAEIRMDDTDKVVWYVFEARPQRQVREVN